MKLIVRDPDRGYLDTVLWVPKAAVNVEGVKNSLTFQLPDRTEGVRFLTLWRETLTHILVPREFWDPHTFSFPVIDCRPKTFEKTIFKSRISLDTREENGKIVKTGDSVQQEAMNALQVARGGILQLACGKGKTVVALELIARRAVPAIVIVDTSQLVEQWRKSIVHFLNVDEKDIGLIGEGQFDWQKPIVIATYKTLGARADSFPEDARRWFGTVVWDEAHHVAAPTFARTADLFSGMRLGLTATPDRADGMHVVYNHHIGGVLYKNLTQDLKPRIIFKWTGLQLDIADPAVSAAVKDVTGEYHFGKIAGYFGKWRVRLEMILKDVGEFIEDGRKVLVLSKSVDEVVNLLAIWCGQDFLYTDIPFPEPADVGESILPMEHTPKQKLKLEKEIAIARSLLKDPHINPIKRQNLEAKVKAIHYQLEQARVWKKCQSLYRKWQKNYIDDLLALDSTGGIMIHKVDVDVRRELLKSKKVVFAISKYGREGLDQPDLDTIVAAEPPGDQNAVQQFMGRILRPISGKKQPIALFMEDDIGPMIGMCKKLRGLLKEWPIEDGGPFDYELIGNPNTMHRRNTWRSVRGSGS